MSKPVLDASAVLASFYGEAGAEAIDDLLRVSIISAVNAAEVISKLAERGMPADMAKSALLDTGIDIIPFDLEQAELVGILRAATRSYGLSLGDRACLALAKLAQGQAVTADRTWLSIEDLGNDVVLFRDRP